VAAPAVVRSMSAQPSPRATARSRSAWPRVASLPPVRQPLSELLAVGTDAGRLTRAELGPSCACPDSAPVVCLSNFWSRPDYLFALPSRYGQVVAKLCLSRLRTRAELCLSRLRTRCVPVQLLVPPRLPVCTAISIWPSCGQAVPVQSRAPISSREPAPSVPVHTRARAELCLSNFRSRGDCLFALPSRLRQVEAKLCLSNLEPQSRAANPRRLCLSTLAPGPSCACPNSARPSCACPDSAPVVCLSNFRSRADYLFALPSRYGQVVAKLCLSNLEPRRRSRNLPYMRSRPDQMAGAA
jgi:hypothetical protein